MSRRELSNWLKSPPKKEKKPIIKGRREPLHVNFFLPEGTLVVIAAGVCQLKVHKN